MDDQKRFARTTKLEIAYTTSGPADGPPVMLLHGWPDAARAWTPVAARLAEAGFRLIIPDLRGSAHTRFISPDIPRDGSGVALARDAIDLADSLGMNRFDVLGHDWGARTAYTMAALFPERIGRIAALALAFQPNAAFELPDFSQARKFWYQWFMALDGGPAAVAADPKGFARLQWDTWSPPGWFDDDEFTRTAAAFDNPDWVPITLNGYRRRWRGGEVSDPEYVGLSKRLSRIDQLSTPTLMIQGGADFCDEPASSVGMEWHFTGGYRRVVLDGVGHFPLREAPDAVADAVIAHLSA
jgi:pimeloyl-ACP methyl ester carboxylesterase